MTTKISLNSLTDSDYKALLQNDKVFNSLIEYTSESTSLMLDDWLNLLDGISDYSLSDSSQYNYMNVSNSYKFLDSVLTVQEDYGLLTDAMAEKVEKVLSDYADSGLSVDYDEKLDEVSKLVVGTFAKFVEAEFDDCMSEYRLLEAMKDYDALISIYGDNAYYNREDNKIYYICTD